MTKVSYWHRRSQKADSLEIRLERAKAGIHRHYARMIVDRENQIDNLKAAISQIPWWIQVLFIRD